jgi:hypothetical protein
MLEVGFVVPCQIMFYAAGRMLEVGFMVLSQIMFLPQTEC